MDTRGLFQSEEVTWKHDRSNDRYMSESSTYDAALVHAKCHSRNQSTEPTGLHAEYESRPS